MEEKPTKNEELAQNPDALHSSEKQGSKQGNSLKIATIICAVLAAAGLGFGVYGFFFKKSEAPTQNTDTSNLESELSSLKQKYSVLQNYVKELEASGTEVSEEIKDATDVAVSFHNAVIASNSDTILTTIFETDDHYNYNRSVAISIYNGEITGCTILTTEQNGYGKNTGRDCQITGISGKISMVSQMGNTQMSWPYIGFLLEDGSAEYISAYELTEDFSASVKGKVSFEAKKPVTNIIKGISSRQNSPEAAGGYQTTAFYHDDGSISFFNSSMVSE